MNPLSRSLFVVAALVAGLSRSGFASDRALDLSVGLGLSFPTEQNGRTPDGTGRGGFAQAEYVFRTTEWFTPRLYTGLLFTSPHDDCGQGVTPCDVSAKIYFLGGKFRLMAPIPYVGPFLELGIGASIGRMRTQIGDTLDVASSGVMFHVPFSLGLALGRDRQFEIAFQYLAHPEQRQVTGGLAIGMTIELD